MRDWHFALLTCGKVEQDSFLEPPKKWEGGGEGGSEYRGTLRKSTLRSRSLVYIRTPNLKIGDPT